MMNSKAQLNDQARSLFSDCTEAVDSGFRFAFQPIIDRRDGRTIGHEALVRGHNGESAASVISAIAPENQLAFDQACRIRALQTAAEVGLKGDLHLNCSSITPDNIAVAVAATQESAKQSGIDPSRVVLEFGNLETLGTPTQLDRAHQIARQAGFRVLADNVGSGEVGLKRLAVFRPSFAKLDRSLIHGIENSPRRQAIVMGIVATCRALGTEVIAAGVENAAEADWLERCEIRFAQGFHFGAPRIRSSARRENPQMLQAAMCFI